jgi:hypothetical protein
VKKSTPPDHPPLTPEEDLTEANARWTTSSTPSARITRTCTTPSGTAETSSIPWGMADPSNLCLLPRHEEDLENLNSHNNRRRGEVEPSLVSTEKSTSSSADMGRKKAKGNKSSMTVRYCWQPLVLPPHIDGPNTQSPSPGQISGSTLPPGQVPAPRRSGDPREQGKEGISGRGKQHQRHLPSDASRLGVPLKELHESDTPFFGIVPTEGEYPLRHIYMPVIFGTPEKYRTEFLRFEVANFDCGYNTIIGRPGLAKFMAIPHYTYMILKMTGPQGIIAVCADFQGAAECFRVAIQAALTTKPSTTSSVQAISKPEEDLVVPANEAQAVTSMRSTEETKRINLRFADERKTAIISSSLDDK